MEVDDTLVSSDPSRSYISGNHVYLGWISMLILVHFLQKMIARDRLRICVLIFESIHDT